MSSSAEVIHCHSRLLILHITRLVCVTQTGFSTPRHEEQSFAGADSDQGAIQTHL